MTKLPASFRIGAWEPGKSNSRGMRTAWLRPLRNGDAGRSPCMLSLPELAYVNA